MIPSPSSFKSQLGAVSIPVTFSLVLTMALTGWAANQVFAPPLLIAALNFSLITLVSLNVAYLSARSYAENGQSTLVLMGAGVLSYGLTFFLLGLAFAVDIAIGVSLATIGLAVGGALQTISSLMTLKGIERIKGNRRLRLGLTYGGTSAFLVSVLLLMLTDTIPPIFGVGTVTNLAGLLICFSLFAVSSLMILRAYLKLKVRVLYWYCIALALVAVGILAFAFTTQVGNPISWVGASSNYLASAYFLKALRSTRK